MKWISLRLLAALLILSILLVACGAPIPAVPVVVILPSETPLTGVTPLSGATPLSGVTPLFSATPGTATASPMSKSDDVWDRIVAANKIVVGTSWDYPPFASVDPKFQAVGFDIALTQEIGRRLNIPVVIQNFAFEGLPAALQTNQVDLAIAAISSTPDRANQMSFSPVYYINQTAILARNDSKVVVITDVSQIAGLHIGVQRGSTYEQMVKSLLVNTGLIHADQLVSYVRADDAVQNLVSKKVDLVVTGLATANYYSAKLGLKVVVTGFNQQNLAVAMRSGTPHLKDQIDRVMNDMLKDGTLVGLITKYLQNDAAGALPTPTAINQPTATALPPVATTAPQACVNGMKYISDVTYPDNNMKTPLFVKPGTGFVKTWRVQNTGTCTWTSDYHLAYAYGNVASAQMNGQPLNMPGNILPGQTVDLSVTLIAPLAPLTYQGFWQIQNANAENFGQTVWVGVTTLPNPLSPTATALPILNPSCVVTLTGPLNAVTTHNSFDAVWTVKNTSTTDWTTTSFDYRFISGAQMHEKATYDFPQTIKIGETGKIIVDMIAPATPGIYTTQWAIVSGGKTMCTLVVNVSVINK